jgi:hypothetical protein
MKRVQTRTKIIHVHCPSKHSGFGGLVVSMPSNSAEAVGFFSGVKILSIPSFGRDVKPCVHIGTGVQQGNAKIWKEEENTLTAVLVVQ